MTSSIHCANIYIYFILIFPDNRLGLWHLFLQIYVQREKNESSYTEAMTNHREYQKPTVGSSLIKLLLFLFCSGFFFCGGLLHNNKKLNKITI